MDIEEVEARLLQEAGGRVHWDSFELPQWAVDLGVTFGYSECLCGSCGMMPYLRMEAGDQEIYPWFPPGYPGIE